MKQKILQALIIFPIIILGYLIANSLAQESLKDFFANFMGRFIFLLFYTIVPVIVGIVLWLYLSELVVGLCNVVGVKKYLFFGSVNFFIPILILLIKAFMDFGYRWNFKMLSSFFKEEYFTAYGFIVYGLLPTITKIVIDLATNDLGKINRTAPNKTFTQ